MKKFVTLATAAAVLGGALMVAPAAEARPGYGAYRGAYYGGYRGGYGRGGRGGVYAGAAAVGLAGALIGGAIASQGYYGRPYGYYAPQPYYAPAPAYGYYGY